MGKHTHTTNTKTKLQLSVLQKVAVTISIVAGIGALLAGIGSFNYRMLQTCHELQTQPYAFSESEIIDLTQRCRFISN